MASGSFLKRSLFGSNSRLLPSRYEVFAKWQLPDAIVYVDDIPLTATGKIDKKPLREVYEDFLLNRA